MLACWIFILYFAFPALASGKDVQTSRFTPYKNENVPVKMAPVGPTIPAASVLACAAQCVSYLQPCNCFMYNKTSHLCTPGSFIVPSQTILDSSLGILYHIPGTLCDNRVVNFTVKTDGSVSSCMWVSTVMLTYQSAKSACIDIGAHLYTMKVPQKLTILLNVVKPMNQEFWLGLDDLDEFQVFRWADDNSVLDIDWPLFGTGQPNFLASEFCVHYSPAYGINDYFCTVMARYVCELSSQGTGTMGQP